MHCDKLNQLRRVIIVRGKGALGSVVVRDTINDLILNSNPFIVSNVNHGADISTILEFGSIKIGLTSIIEPTIRFIDFIDDCKQLQCNIIVAACKVRGNNLGVIKSDLRYPYYVIEWCYYDRITTSTDLSVIIAQAVQDVKARLIGISI